MALRSSGNLWGITSYFNPAGYSRRLHNYHLFRQYLTVPLVTVELSFNGSFQLQPADADVLVQLHGRDVMWQKERLLNLALQYVPATCDKIAWIDCDVLFERPDWAERASRALDDYPLLHLFQTRYDPPRDTPLSPLDGWDTWPKAPSTIQQMAVGAATPEDVFQRFPGVKGWHASNGLAWASRRDVLEAHGWYDACIIGGGDRAMVGAAIGRPDYCVQAHRMNTQRAAHYRTWADAFFATVRGGVCYIPERLVHLWHGETKDRQAEARHRGLAAYNFDPYLDIALDHNGCWRWNSDKHELHAFVRRYFASRHEDGL